MKKLTLHMLVLAIVLVFPVEDMRGQNGIERSNMEVINDMAPGWNLGNTFEAVATWAGVDFLNNVGGLSAETS